VPEVAKVREAQRHVAPCHEDGARIEARRRREVGSDAAASADTDATATGTRQSTPAYALNRCGDAEPSVSAPTRMPTISPMSPFAQVDASFMPTG
jgi:hypothetical protein